MEKAYPGASRRIVTGICAFVSSPLWAHEGHFGLGELHVHPQDGWPLVLALAAVVVGIVWMKRK